MPTNPFLDMDEDETPDQSGSSDNPNFKQLRDYAKKLEKQVNQLSKANETLTDQVGVFETERRTAQVTQVFKKVGLSPKHASLFSKLHEGEVTEEAVVQFATEYELPRQDVQQEGQAPAADTGISPDGGQVFEVKTEDKPAVQAGFEPVQGAAAPAAQVITDAEQAEKLMVTNPSEYARLHQAGRIKLERLPGSGESKLPGAAS